MKWTDIHETSPAGGRRHGARLSWLAAAVLLATAASARAQAPDPAKGTLEVYGFGQGDAIADFNQVNPAWADTLRPSRLPSYPNEFGNDGRFSVSAKQSRLGVRGELPTANGPVKGQFEFDMFGTGSDAGLTTIRLRHAWGQWGKVGAGQTNTQFMDIDAFPNVIDYWGPNGMAFIRLPQVFYEFFNREGGSHARIAIENPGASGDAGAVADRIELQNIKPRFPMPDITGHYRMGGLRSGYLQFGGVIGKIAYDDLIANDRFDLNGDVWRWGVAISAGLKFTGHDLLHLQFIDGAGIENYFNDAPIDVGAKSNSGNAVTPVVGEALRDIALLIYLDHNWNDRTSTTIGYSRVDIHNSNLQAPSAYKNGQYATGNLLFTPVKNVMMGGELQWGRRENFSDGFGVNDLRLQFSFKYSFGYKIGG
jgi:DcaP outer membrane protein